MSTKYQPRPGIRSDYAQRPHLYGAAFVGAAAILTLVFAYYRVVSDSQHFEMNKSDLTARLNKGEGEPVRLMRNDDMLCYERGNEQPICLSMR
jgi:hypothetical protein